MDSTAIHEAKPLPTIDLLVIAWNRAAYTQRTLSHLLETVTPRTRIWIWQNGTDAATCKVVHGVEDHPAVHRVHYSATNVQLREPTNWFWQESDATLVGKVDDDCLMPTGWLERLSEAHVLEPRLGVISAWPFREEDHRPASAQQKVRSIDDSHAVMVNPWTGGSGYLVKRATIEELGLLGADEPFSRWCMRAARRGWINGWMYPFIYMDHMDDPRSLYTQLKTEEDFERNMPLSAVVKGIPSLAEIRERTVRHAVYLQTCSPDVRSHQGVRRRVATLRARCAKFLGSGSAWTH